MNCSVALQYLPMNAGSDDEVCRIVDEVIAEIDASGLDYYVGPFETAIEGDFDACMDLVKRCIQRHKIGKYHQTDSEFQAKEQSVA